MPERRPAAPGAPKLPRRPRVISRALAGLALLVLGAVSAWRLPVAYLPSFSFPELTVTLSLGDTEDLGSVTRRYVLPVESSLRSLGDVRDTLGEVSATGGRWRVRLEPGTDLERKSSRLDSELEALRRRLPDRASLSVDPAVQVGGDQSTLVWLPSAAGPAERSADRNLVESLRALAEVRAVVVAGEAGAEVRIRALERRQDLGALRAAVEAAPQALGHASDGGRHRPVLSLAADGPLKGRTVRRGAAAVPLGGLAHVDLRREDPTWQAHVDGGVGLVLVISREPEASPLALRAGLDRVLRDHGRGDARVLVDEAEPLRFLLERLVLGAALAAAALFALGCGLGRGGLLRRVAFGLSQAALVPLSASAVLCAFWLFGHGLDVTTLPALAVAVAVASLLHSLRHGGADDGRMGWAWLWMTLAAVMVPVAVVLAGGSMGTLLAAPARALAVAVAASGLAIFLVPSHALGMEPRALGLLRFLMRRPWAVLLSVAAASYLLLVMFGDGLMPRPGRLSPVTADLSLTLRFTQGTTAAEAESLVARAEETLGEQPEVTEHWSVFDRRRATLGVRVVAGERTVARLSSLAGRLEILLQPLGATVRASPLAAAGGEEPLRFDDSLTPKPELAEDQVTYRLILRSADASLLQRALERVEEIPRRDGWLKDKLIVGPDWGPGGEQWLLRPRPGSDPALRRRALGMLAERGRLPVARPALALPGDSRPISQRVVDAAAPERPEDPAELFEILAAQETAGGPMAARELFDVETALGSPTVMRQGGSFVLPITIRLQRLAIGQRNDAVFTLHSTLRGLRWPSGVDRELPELRTRKWTRERMRLIAVASTLPLLLLFLSVTRLDSLPLGLAAALPSVVALAAVAPALFAGPGGPDELALLALAGSLAVVWALSAEVASGVRVFSPSPLAVAPGFRFLAHRLPAAAGLCLAWPALLLLPTSGLPSDRHAWVTALRLAGLAGTVGGVTAFLVLPVLLQVVDRVRFHDRAAAREAARPPAWRRDDRLELSVRNLNKIYGNGFQALRRVDFRLEPGIIGLLGPNGAGKTTLLRCLCGLLSPTRGQVLFRGVPVGPHNLPEYRRLVGFLPQSFNAYEGFTVEAFLDFWALERGLHEAKARRRELEKVLAQVGLEEAASRRVRELSGGMRRRIGIARALLGAPPILIVDEPTTGLDVESRNRLRESLLQAAGERIILFSTHIASDVAAAASRILILDGGRLSFDGSAAELIEGADGRIFETLLGDDELRGFSSRYRVTTRVRTLEGIRVRAVAAPGQEPAGKLVRPNLEEAYLAKLGMTPHAPGGGKRQGSLLDLGV